MREHLKSNIKKSFINGAGAEIRTRVPGSTVPEDDHLPYPGMIVYKKIVKVREQGFEPWKTCVNRS